MTDITTTIHRAMSHRLHLGRLLTANALHAPLPAAVAPGTRSAASGRAGRLLLVQPREGKPSTGVVARPSRSPSGSDGSRGWATLFELANTALCVLVALAVIAITQVAAPAALDAVWPDASPDPLLWAAGVAGLLWLCVVGFFFVTTNRHGGR